MKKKQKNTSIQKEIDHKIKNNLNIVSSILGLEIYNLKYNSTYNIADILKKNKLRIETLAIVHDSSNKSADAKNVDFKKFVKSLSDLYNSDIEIEVKAKQTNIELDTMLGIGIILNELLTNSLKYAFSHKKDDKKILITLKKFKNSCLLTYYEKGNKLVDIAKIKQNKTLGIKLIILTIKQMKADMNITQNGGLLFTIDFKCQV